MPFGEVMYRCNAHYCFSSVFRNRVAGLVITLALMQLFLFSFYLNGLHNQAVVTAGGGTGFVVGSGSLSSSEQQMLEGVAQLQPLPQPHEQQPLPTDQPANEHPRNIGASLAAAGAAAAAAIVRDIDLDRRSGSVGQEAGRPDDDAFLNPAISKAKVAMGDAAKKALDRLVINNKPAMDLVAMAAKKLSVDPNDPVAKLGFNLLANTLNNVKNPRNPSAPKQQQQQNQQQQGDQRKEQEKIGGQQKQQQLDVTATESSSQSAAVERSNEELSPLTAGAAAASASDAAEDPSKSQYANLAQMGLQMLTNNLVDPSSLSALLANKGSAAAAASSSSPDTRMLEMASQLMWQSAKLSKSGFDPQMAKTALGLLKGAVASQKLDPRVMLSLAARIMQQQQQQSSGGGGDATNAGFNMLSQLLSNSQLTSALLTAGAAAAASAQPAVSAAQSNTIYRNYVKQTSRNLPALKSKMSSPYSMASSKVVVDIGFHYAMEQVDACRSNATYLVMAVSAAAHVEEREAARETWIKDFRQLIGGKIDFVFIIGQTSNVTLQRAVEEEAATHRDLIQTNVQEPVENAVFKTLAGLVWIDRNCPEIEQILKIDDDVYVSAARMLKALEKGKAAPTITGSMIDSMNPHTTLDKRHKTPKRSWPLKEFPRFILGGAYLLGRPAVPRLLAAAQMTPILPLEDVYVTGLCATGGKVELIPNKSLFEEEISEELEVCTFEDFASWRSTGAADIKQTWNFAQAMKRSGEVCVRTNKCARTFMGICIPST